MNDRAPLIPRNGHTLVVGITARISGCPNQKELSLDDQVDHGKDEATALYEGDIEYRIIATRGKGERLDRPELAEIEKALSTGELDLHIIEDLGRLVRGPEAVRLLGVGVDHGTRTIVPNDEIDTNDANWEEAALSACREHVAHQSATSKRLKQKLMNRFVKSGAATARPIFGYVVPDDAQTYFDWRKDPEATPVIAAGLRRLRETLNCSIVAEMFNQQKVPVGPYCRSKQWDGKMIRRFYRNPLLKGAPGRGFLHSVKKYGKGRRVSQKNPKGPKFIDCPHLAHVDAAELDDVNQLLQESNSNFRRRLINGRDPLFSVARTRAVFPARCARCWYCGRPYVRGGNGVTENLMCPGAREWRCWNSIGFNGEMAVKKVVAAITEELYRLDGFDAQFRDMVASASRDADVGATGRRHEIQRQQQALEREKDNLLAAIMKYGTRPMFAEKLAELDALERSLNRELRQLESDAGKPLQLPQSVTELREVFERHFSGLAANSWEFGQIMQTLVPEFHVYLVRLCDGGHLLPRAKLKLSLASIVPDAAHLPELGELLTREVTLDFFEPPQRERIRAEAVQLAAQNLEQRQIAGRIDDSPTQTAVYKALKLHKKMSDLGLTNPYELVVEPPADYSKLRRPGNRKYRFESIGGYVPPAI